MHCSKCTRASSLTATDFWGIPDSDVSGDLLVALDAALGFRADDEPLAAPPRKAVVAPRKAVAAPPRKAVVAQTAKPPRVASFQVAEQPSGGPYASLNPNSVFHDDKIAIGIHVIH